MKMHIEYDDFGEYVENLEDLMEDTAQVTITGGISDMKKMVKKVLLTVAMLTVMLSTSSYASGTCGVKGCYKSAVYGGSYCRNHTCSKSGCKNLSVDGGYCSDHQKKTYGGNSSTGQTTSKTCLVSGCNKSTTGGSAYCYTHKCKHYSCKNYGSDDGYCSSHAKKSSSTGSFSSGKTGSTSSTSKQCIVTGCHNTKSGSSSYCAKHKCRYSGCNSKADASGYCSKHHYKSSDPYDVYDYDDPEDFYYDWEDDFEDYEDAEDYWEEAWH